MSAAIQARRWRRRGAQGMTAALLLALAVGGGSAAATAVQHEPAAEPAASGVQTVSGGSFNWGVRQSIRNYLENFGHTAGFVAGYQGATYQLGDSYASFPVASGTVDIDAQTASIAVDGELEMFGFGDPWLHFEDVRIEIAGGTATVIVDMIESYNVRTRTDDVALATFDVPAGGLAIEDDTLTLATAAGRFPENIGLNHLPAYGGPTYVAPNDRTDPFTLTLELGEAGDPGDPGEPGGGEAGGGDPETGPYGVSAGVPLSGTTSYMRVTPGYSLNADGSTEITVEGFGFDPGPVVAPGEGSGGIYVGLGTMASFDNPEKWRRSQGGSSGPVGLADYTYGAPRFVVNQGSADADIADGAMDANGSWSVTFTIPGPQIASFFGDTIDCLELQCGVFSFGAHGAVKAANEAFVPIYFEGQNESEWPDRDTEEPTPIPTPERPQTPGTPPAETLLTSANRGSVLVSVTGSTARVSVGSEHQNTYVGAAVYSDPRFIDWYLVQSNGQITVPLPADLEEVEHKLAVLDTENEVIGWDSFTLESETTTIPPAKGEPTGTSTGTNASGASLTVSPAYALKDSEQVVTLTGTGYPTSRDGNTNGGFYVLFGWVDSGLGEGWKPSQGGSSASTFTYAKDGLPAGSYQRAVNFPGAGFEPGQITMDAGGNWTMEFPIASSQFTSAQERAVDCYQVQCGIITIGAMGGINAGGEVFTPVYFTDTADGTGNTTPPASGSGGVVANANMQSNSGLSVNGGLAALAQAGSEARTAMGVGVLVLSAGLLGAALLYSRRLRNSAESSAVQQSMVRPSAP